MSNTLDRLRLRNAYGLEPLSLPPHVLLEHGPEFRESCQRIVECPEDRHALRAGAPDAEIAAGAPRRWRRSLG